MVSLECDKHRISLEPSSSYFRSDDCVNQTLLELRYTHIIHHYNCLSSVRECLQLDTKLFMSISHKLQSVLLLPELAGAEMVGIPGIVESLVITIVGDHFIAIDIYDFFSVAISKSPATLARFVRAREWWCWTDILTLASLVSATRAYIHSGTDEGPAEHALGTFECGMLAISYSYVLAKFLIILWTSGIPARVPLVSKYWKRIDSLDYESGYGHRQCGYNEGSWYVQHDEVS